MLLPHMYASKRSDPDLFRQIDQSSAAKQSHRSGSRPSLEKGDILPEEDPFVSRLSALSLLELTIVVAGARLSARDMCVFTTAQLYAEYKHMVADANLTASSQMSSMSTAGAGDTALTRHVKFWGFSVFIHAVANAVDAGLLLPTTSNNFVTHPGRGHREFDKWACDINLLELQRALKSRTMARATEDFKKWTRSIADTRT